MSKKKKKSKKAYAKDEREANVGAEKTSAPLESVEETKPSETSVREPSEMEETEGAESIKRRMDILRSEIDKVAGDGFIREAGKSKNDGFIYDIVSNTVSFGNAPAEQCAEFIACENGRRIYEIHSRALVDSALDDIANVRRCCSNKDYLSHAAAIVKETLNNVEHGNNGFYYLPDNTDVFSKNIKSGFSGYTYVWRSVAAAYRRYYYGGDVARYGMGTGIGVDVVDLFENEPAKISISTKTDEEYGDEVMFTRCGKSKIDVERLSYVNVAGAFWKEYFKGKGLAMSEVVAERLINCDATYNLLCQGRPFDFVYDDRPYAVGKSDAEDFLRRYVSRHKTAVDRLAGCVVYGDFLRSTGFADKVELLLSDNEHGKPLEKYKERRKNGIPLWIETLPELTLNRTANKKRFGGYVLVKKDEKVKNVFEPRGIICKEKLTLPAGHKEICFPLTIRGITDKKYVAKIKMDDALKTAKDFDVELRYDFNNENPYQFILSNKEVMERQLRIVIEKGEPERMDLPFELRCGADEEDLKRIYDEIYEGLRGIEEAVGNRSQKREYEKHLLKEKDWEKKAREACRRLFFAWVGLPYERKEQKKLEPYIERKLSDVLGKTEGLSEMTSDQMEKRYVKYVSATLTLVSSDLKVDLLNDCKEYLSDPSTSDVLVQPYVTMVLCNPDISSTSECVENVVDWYGKNGKEIFETLPLPLLANDNLLDYFCKRENKYKLLSRSGKYLSETFKGLYDRLADNPASSKRTDVDWPKMLRRIRNAYELALGLLKLRKTEYWPKVENIEEALPVAIKLEERLYRKLSEGVPDANDYLELVSVQKGIKKDIKKDKDKEFCELLISRVKFKPEDSLSLMHPLALTAITYLQGNPNIHMVGCGLRGD